MSNKSSVNPQMLPDGAEIDRMRNPKRGVPVTYEAIGRRYGVSRQAAHKAHVKWLREREERAAMVEVQVDMEAHQA